MVYILDYSLVLITCNIIEVDSTSIDDKERALSIDELLCFSFFQRVSILLFEISLFLPHLKTIGIGYLEIEYSY